MSERMKEDNRPQPVEHPKETVLDEMPENVYIDAEDAPFPIESAPYRRFVLYLLEAGGESDAEISLSLVGDDAIRELNRQYRGQDCSTDVLSFSLREGEPVGQQYALGDLVISVETAQRQAEQYGNQVEEEINELIFHGFLHLLGYDHEALARREWDKAESRLIGELRRLHSSFCPKGLIPQGTELPINEGSKI